MLNGFKEEEVNKYIDYLNFVARNATFNNLSQAQIVEYYQLLATQEQTMLPKMKSLIVGEPKVHTPEPKPKKARKAKAAE